MAKKKEGLSGKKNKVDKLEEENLPFDEGKPTITVYQKQNEFEGIPENAIATDYDKEELDKQEKKINKKTRKETKKPAVKKVNVVTVYQKQEEFGNIPENAIATDYDKEQLDKLNKEVEETTLRIEKNEEKAIKQAEELGDKNDAKELKQKLEPVNEKVKKVKHFWEKTKKAFINFFTLDLNVVEKEKVDKKSVETKDNLAKTEANREKPENKENDDFEELYEEAKKFVLENNDTVASHLRKEFGITHELTKKLLNKMEERGVVGPSRKGKKRKILEKKVAVKNTEEEREEEYKNKTTNLLTQEAEDLISKKGVPTFITNNLKKIAEENNIEITNDMSATDVIEALKHKKQSEKKLEGSEKGEKYVEENAEKPVFVKEGKKEELEKERQELEKEQIEIMKKDYTEKVKKAEKKEKRSLTNEEKKDIYLKIVEGNNKLKEKTWMERNASLVTKVYKKSTKWWNKEDKGTSGKLVKIAISSTLIGASVIFGGDKTGLIDYKELTNMTKEGLLARRLLATGLMASALTISAEKIKGRYDKLGRVGKTGTLVLAGVGGLGLAISFAGVTTLGVIGGAIAGKVATNKLIFNKGFKLKNKEEKVKSLEKDKEDFDINTFIDKLPEVQREIDKLNNQINNLKTARSISNGAWSIAAGIGAMNFMNSEINDTVRSKISNLWKGIMPGEGGGEEIEVETKTEVEPDIIGEERETIETLETGKVILPEEDIKNIERPTKADVDPNAIIDGEERVGINYAFRDQLIADESLAEELGIDHSKLDDPKYVAEVTKDLAIKLGYMTEAGEEIRISKDGIGKIAYELGVDEDGKVLVNEIDVESGKIIETHCEGDNFEGKNFNKEYEYNDGKEHHYKDFKEVANTQTTPTILERPGNVTSATDLGSGAEEILTRPGEVTDLGEGEPVIEPREVTETKTVENSYLNKFEKSPIWEDVKKMKIRDFFEIGKVNMTTEQIEIAELLRSEYALALGKDADLEAYIHSHPGLTVEGALETYNDIINKDLDIRPSLDTGDDLRSIEDQIAENEDLGYIQKIAENNDYKLTPAQLKDVQSLTQKNLNTIFGKDMDNWFEIKDQSASKYMDLEGDDHLSVFLARLKEVTGLNPENGFLGLGKKEQIDEYIIRATIKAEIDGNENLIIVTKSAGDEIYQEGLENKTSSNKGDDLYRN